MEATEQRVEAFLSAVGKTYGPEVQKKVASIIESLGRDPCFAPSAVLNAALEALAHPSVTAMRGCGVYGFTSG